MRQVRHVFSDNREAQAFICGVNWVNDDSLEVIDVEVGDEDDGKGGRRITATVVVNDEGRTDWRTPWEEDRIRREEGDDYTFDHRDHL